MSDRVLVVVFAQADSAAQAAKDHVKEDAKEIARRESQALLNETSVEAATEKEKEDSELAEALDKAKAKFAELDADKSGKLEVEEMHEMSKWVFEKRGMSDEERAAAYKKLEELDTNKDGALDFDEFSAWFTSEAGAAQMKAAAAAKKERIAELKASGHEFMAAGKHPEAIGSWDAARQLDPEDATLPVLIQKAKVKIEEAAKAAAEKAAAEEKAKEAARQAEELEKQKAIEIAERLRQEEIEKHAKEAEEQKRAAEEPASALEPRLGTERKPRTR